MKDIIDLHKEILDLRLRLCRSQEALKEVRTVAKIYGDGTTKYVQTSNEGFESIIKIADKQLTD